MFVLGSYLSTFASELCAAPLVTKNRFYNEAHDFFAEDFVFFGNWFLNYNIFVIKTSERYKVLQLCNFAIRNIPHFVVRFFLGIQLNNYSIKN